MTLHTRLLRVEDAHAISPGPSHPPFIRLNTNSLLSDSVTKTALAAISTTGTLFALQHQAEAAIIYTA